MPRRTPLPDGTVTLSEAQILVASPKRLTNLRWQGSLEPVSTPHRKIGVLDRAEVQALAAVPEARGRDVEQRREQQLAEYLARRSAV
jgi:hypothetical protein